MPGSQSSRPTIRDVARAAGVSYQTVSRVLNDHPRVAPDTRERVLRAMKKLGYERNLAAQMLTTQRSHTIQLITVDGKFPFTLPLLDSAQWGDYSALYCECPRAQLPQVFDRAAARMVEGIFLYASKLTIDDDALLEITHGIPIVRRDFALDSRRITWVGFDQVRATQIAVQHLLDLGHRHAIALVVRWPLPHLDLVDVRFRANRGDEHRGCVVGERPVQRDDDLGAIRYRLPGAQRLPHPGREECAVGVGGELAQPGSAERGLPRLRRQQCSQGVPVQEVIQRRVR